MLRVEGLWKSYGTRAVVAGVSLAVGPGEIVGLLGPNGAGKTTTVAMICGLIAPDRGQVTLDGATMTGDADAVKRRVGVAPQELALYEDLPALANLELFGALYGLRRPRLREQSMQALELVGLADRARDKPATYSGGMKRRLNIACALVHDPAVVLLDEPTAGVDPQSRNAIFENLEALKARGKAIVYTTHYMEEAERLCDRIVIIDHGKVIASDTLRGLYRMLPAAESLEVEFAGGSGAIDTEALLREPGVKTATLAEGRLVVGIDDLTRAPPVVLSWLAARGQTVQRISSGHANLEAVFLALTGRQLRD